MILEGKVVIVTGAGRGIGFGIAEAMAIAQAKVVLATLDAQEGIEAQAAIRAAGGDATFVQTDVREESSTQQAVREAVRLHGRLDVLVNSAGITVFKSLFEVTQTDWDALMDVDLKGLFFFSKHAARRMREQGGGVIINISSNHAAATLPDAEVYAAAKGGLNAMTRAMALSLGPFGIRVVSLSPGFTDTPHYRHWLAETTDPKRAEQDILALHAERRISNPQDVGHIAVFLASDAARTITGTDITADNGLSSRLYHGDGF